MAAQAATQASQIKGGRAMSRYSTKEPMVYMLASKSNGTLYIGVTSNLYERMRAHREGTFEGFTKKYDVKTLVYYEVHATMENAIKRESQLKKWRRLWKIRLIEEMNPTWSDLFDEQEGMLVHGDGGQSVDDWQSE